MRTLLGSNLIIEQNQRDAFNLDTVLLANFALVPAKTKCILDIGTGSGALMLYLSEKTRAKIIGVEIQESRYLQAVYNIELNDLMDQLTCVHQDIKTFQHKKVDYIISNPPFFKVNESSKLNQHEEHTIARHEMTLTLEDLAKHVSRLLKFGGKFSMIHRPERFAEIVETFNKYQLTIKRIRFVHPYIDKKPNHLLIEAVKNGHFGVVVEPPLIIYRDKHVLTEEMIKIYGGHHHVT